MKTCKSTSGGINKTFVIKPSEESCNGVSTNHLFSCSGDTSISLSTGEIVIIGDLTPVQDGVGAIGLPNRRFREVNTISGTSTTWVSTVSVETSELILGDDSNGNNRIINADNSVIQDDILNGGDF